MAYNLFAFSFLEFETGASQSRIKFCIRYLTFFFENVGIVPRNTAKFEKPVKIFLKCPFWSIDLVILCKTEKSWNQNILTNLQN